jgi:hypothetical protein
MSISLSDSRETMSQLESSAMESYIKKSKSKKRRVKVKNEPFDYEVFEVPIPSSQRSHISIVTLSSGDDTDTSDDSDSDASSDNDNDRDNRASNKTKEVSSSDEDEDSESGVLLHEDNDRPKRMKQSDSMNFKKFEESINTLSTQNEQLKERLKQLEEEPRPKSVRAKLEEEFVSIFF